MKEEDILEELSKRGLILDDGHFVYPGGKHGTHNVDKDALLTDTKLAGMLVHEMTVSYLDDIKAPWPDVVVGPGSIGAVLAYLVALDLGKFSDCGNDDPVYAAFVERDQESGLFKLCRNYDKVVRGRNVLIVEDVMSGGVTVGAAAHAVMMAGGIVVGASVIYNRGTSSKIVLPGVGGRPLEIPVSSLVHRPHPSYTESECREIGPCSRGEPFSPNFGHGSAFFEKGRPLA